MSEALSAAALVLAAAKSGGSGAPEAYLKSASVSDNTLTLTNKDDTTVTFTPEEPDVDKAYVDDEIARVEAEIPTVPTNVSAFTNDAGYLTSHQDISGLATKTELTAETTAREAAETVLTNAINTKQGTLTAGSNITIDSNNVISATGGGGSEGAVRYDEAQTLTDAQQMQARANQGLPYILNEAHTLITNFQTSQSASAGNVFCYWNLSSSVFNEFAVEGTKFIITVANNSSNPTASETIECEVLGNDSFKVLTDVTNYEWFNSESDEGYMNNSLIRLRKKSTSDSTDWSGGNVYVTAVYYIQTFLSKLDKRLIDDSILNITKIGKDNDGIIKGISIYDASPSKSYQGITMGNSNEISLEGAYSIAGGYVSSSGRITAYTHNIAFGESSGYGNIDARGQGSICVGYADEQRTDGQSSMGTHGKASQAFGYQTKAGSHYQMAIGKNNIRDDSQTYGFILGNGANISSRNNAFTVDWQGNGVFAGTVSSSGSDYAEFFEWKDGNPNNEDRIAYIVALDGDKLVLANSADDMLGIISGTTSMTGDDAEWTWHKKFLQDKYGRFIYEDYDVVHDEGTEYEWVEHVHTRKINPDYDPERPYTPRSERPEWDEVGLLGKLYVRDDGSCEVGGYASPVNGIATKSNERTNMKVLERIDANTIRVLLK